jgi:hypothetical protein
MPPVSVPAVSKYLHTNCLPVSIYCDYYCGSTLTGQLPLSIPLSPVFFAVAGPLVIGSLAKNVVYDGPQSQSGQGWQSNPPVLLEEVDEPT